MNRTVLVAEDDAGINKLICNRVISTGCTVLSARTGPETLVFLENETIDLMVLDYRLPGMDGSTIVAEMKKMGKKTPFITITGNGDERIAVEMMKAGAVDYLVKDLYFINVLPEKVLKALKDIETRKELEQSREALRESEKKSKEILDSMQDPVYICSNDYHLQYANPSFLRILGGEIPDLPCYTAVFGLDGKCQYCKQMDSTLNQNITVSAEIQVEGKPRSFQISITPISYINGQFSRLHLLRDVTEIVSAKERAETSQQEQKRHYALLRTVIDNIPDQIYVKDLESRYLLNNSGHQAELNAGSQEELTGKTDFDFFDRETALEFYKDEQKILGSGNPMINKEEYKTYQDQRSRWTLTTKVPIFDERGNITGIAGINRDITRRKKIE
jgi:PAS domain S-box-containing protein